MHNRPTSESGVTVVCDLHSTPTSEPLTRCLAELRTSTKHKEPFQRFQCADGGGQRGICDAQQCALIRLKSFTSTSNHCYCFFPPIIKMWRRKSESCSCWLLSRGLEWLSSHCTEKNGGNEKQHFFVCRIISAGRKRHSEVVFLHALNLRVRRHTQNPRLCQLQGRTDRNETSCTYKVCPCSHHVVWWNTVITVWDLNTIIVFRSASQCWCLKTSL